MLNNLKKFLQEKKKLVQFFSIITWFTIIFSIFFVNQTSFFKADLLNVFDNQIINWEGYDIFMWSYTGVTLQWWSVRFFAWKDLKNIQMINFDLSYDSNEVMIKQDLEWLFWYFDFQDILVNQDAWKAKITLMSSKPVNIAKNTAFLKIETFLKKLNADSKTEIKIENIQFVDDSMKFFAWMWKKWFIKIWDTDIENWTWAKLFSLSKNFCEIWKNSWENLCEIKFFWNNIENFSWSVAWQKFSLDWENKINFDFAWKNIQEWIYDAFVSSWNTILKLENAIYLAESDEDLWWNLNSLITVISDKSYTIPAKVLNNNSMTVDLWAKVDSPDWVNLINKVTANLSVLWWSPVAQMKKKEIVDNKVWFVLEWVKVSQTTAIWNQDIEITAEDTEWNTSTWKIVVNVTNDLMVSATPELSWENITYNKTTKQIDVFVKVSDADWITDISSVNVDLTSLGLWYKELYALSRITDNSNVSPDNQNFWVIENWELYSKNDKENWWNSIFDWRVEKKSEIFRLQSPLELPSDVKIWDYNIVFTAFDKSWEEATLVYNYSHKSWSAPQFVRKVDNVDDDYDMNYVRLNRYKIPNDNDTTFDLSTIVKDEDWANDIVEVRADLTWIWWDVVQLEKQWDDIDSSNVKSAIYNLKWVKIPATVRTWWHEFQLVAYDKQWNETAVTVEIQVLDPSSWAFANSKDTIKINSEKAYNEPNLAINDNKTTFTMNVFVENQWHEIEDVILNFWNLARYIWWEENSSSENCKNQNERIVCMKHSVKEWSKWQWFRLDNIVIPENTKPSVERYRVKTIAIQKWWRSVEWYSYITVSDWTLPEEWLWSPKLQMAISLSPNKVQLVFTNPLNKENISKTKFKIANTDDDTDQISIKDLKINTDATIITLETWNQEPWKKYTVIADTEKLWLKEDSYTDNHKIFYWFDKEEIAPHLINTEVLSDTKIALTFDQWLMPTSLEQKWKNFIIFEKRNPEKTLKVLTKEFSWDDNKTIYISTEKQKMNKNYVIIIKNIQSAAWVRFWDLKNDLKYSKWQYFWITKEFVWYNDVEEMHATAKTKSLFELSNSVQDKCVDFRDFTMFSRDYKAWVPSSEFFDYNFDNKIDFMDFTIFSKQYWKCEEVEKIKDKNFKIWNWTWGDVLNSWTWNDLENNGDENLEDNDQNLEQDLLDLYK